MFWLYNLLLAFTLPLWLPWMWWRARKRGKLPDRAERSGQYEFRFDRDRMRLWVHAVSVGEVVAAIPFLKHLRGLEPSVQILLTVTTTSGKETANKLALGPGLVDQVAFFPVDLMAFTLSAVGRVRPHAVAIMETELWMNFLQACRMLNAKTFLVNGRISDRSFGRSRWLAFFYASIFDRVDEGLFQSQADFERAKVLGCKRGRVTGNMKYDEAVESSFGDRRALRAKYGVAEDEVLILVGSTRGLDEQRFVLNALGGLAPGSWKVIHAPRHMETADALESEAGAVFEEVARRSRDETGKYLILDTYGELASLYSAADIAIIGGGFENFGGQNLIQALAARLPVLRGPHFQNFREAADAASQAGADIVCRTPEALAEALQNLIADPQKRFQMADAAWSVVAESVGASARNAEIVIAAARERAARS